MKAKKEKQLKVNDIISVEEASDILKVTKNRVQAMVRQGVIKWSKTIGKRTMILDKNEIVKLSDKERPAGNPNWV